MRRVAALVLLGLAGIVAAAAVGIAVSRLTSVRVGLAGETSSRLAPVATTPTRTSPPRTTATTPRRRTRPRTTPAAPPPAVTTPPVTAPPAVAPAAPTPTVDTNRGGEDDEPRGPERDSDDD